MQGTAKALPRFLLDGEIKNTTLYFLKEESAFVHQIKENNIMQHICRFV